MSYAESDKSSLASLALVNSDYRQLARSCQFRTVVFDYSPKSNALLVELQGETLERGDSEDNRTKRPSVGACIRCVRAKLNDVSQAWIKAMKDNRNESRSLYDSRLTQIVPHLPHLDTLDLSNLVTIDSTFLNLLANSRSKHLRHLRLQGYVGPEITNIRIDEGASWPLESLDIEVRLELMNNEERDIDSSRYWDSLFRACSSTLQSLMLDQIILLEDEDLDQDSLDEPITFTAEFPRLESLHMGPDINICPSTFKRLLQSERLSTLFFNPDRDSTAECLVQIDQLKSLRTLAWCDDSLPIKHPAMVHLLEASPHLRAFVTCMQFSATFQHSVLSALGACSSLKVLSLRWWGTSIDDLSLDA
ncbi:hypothetical protein BDW74DRAFT_181860 [Aspergillus multicolor]|uniref:uncharacterized protein n=1 Tax=Aspergillus multicolor TaxID=41759 RepID=UPI003CCCA063